MTFVNLAFVPEILGLFGLFVTTTASVQGGRSMFVSLISLPSLHSTKKITESLEMLGLE